MRSASFKLGNAAWRSSGGGETWIGELVEGVAGLEEDEVWMAAMAKTHIATCQSDTHTVNMVRDLGWNQ